jgi:hypothetical protein
MTSNSHPAALRRRNGSQAFLLEKYEEFGTFREAFGELVHLHQRDLDHYRQITGSNRLPQYETVCRYWKEIPLTERRSAKQRFLRRS